MARQTAFASGVWIAGRHTSLALQGGSRRVQLLGQLSSVDVADPALAMTLTVEVAPSSSGPWAFLAGCVYHGGMSDPDTGTPLHPLLAYERSSDLPAFYRVVLDLPRPVTIGCELDDGV